MIHSRGRVYPEGNRNFLKLLNSAGGGGIGADVGEKTLPVLNVTPP